MNSASMATNLLGRTIRLRERPVQCSTDEGTICLVAIDDRETHFLVLVDGRLIPIDDCNEFVILN